MGTPEMKADGGGDVHDSTADGPHFEHIHTIWPLVGAAGAGALYFGVGLFFVGREIGVVPWWISTVLIALGTLGLVTGLVGWLYEAFIDSYWTQRVTQTRQTYRATMLLFLGTDLSTFAALFVYYFFVRYGAWPPSSLPSDLLGLILVVNTLVLIASSVTLHFSHTALEAGQRRRFIALLGLTFVLGIVFLAGQAFEYYSFIVEEGFTLTSGIFGTAFFGLTGLHGLHVALGVVLLGILFGRALRGQYSETRDTSVTTVSLYWHFVDVVWLFLVVTLYVGAAVGTLG